MLLKISCLIVWFGDRVARFGIGRKILLAICFALCAKRTITPPSGGRGAITPDTQTTSDPY